MEVDEYQTRPSRQQEPMDITDIVDTLTIPMTVFEESMNVETSRTEAETIAAHLQQTILHFDALKAKREWCLVTAIVLLDEFNKTMSKALVRLNVDKHLHDYYSNQQYEFIMKRVIHHIGMLHFHNRDEESKPPKIWWKKKRQAVLSHQVVQLYESVAIEFKKWKTNCIASAIAILSRMHNRWHFSHCLDTSGESIPSCERILVVDKALTIVYWTVRNHHAHK